VLAPVFNPGYYNWQPSQLGTFFLKSPIFHQCVLGLQIMVTVTGR
jgi:hypothetical protein